MKGRREFLKAAGAGTAGLAVLGSGSAIAAQGTRKTEAPPRTHSAPHDLPSRVLLLSIRHADGSETLGAKTENGVIDVARAAKLLGQAAPLTMHELLAGNGARSLNALISAAKTSPRAKPALLEEASITHGRLFDRPGKILCVGLNYRRHAQEVNVPVPRVPPLFNKYNNALAGQNCVIKLPPRQIAYKFDYETELLIVIGKTARNVAEADALNFVAGYCTANDFSARDLQLELPAGQWMIGKTLDNFGPIGPYFVSADLVGDPNALKIETRVNGELRQSSNTSDFIFNVQQMVSYISRHWALEPGDIIFTGTPEGVILGYPKDRQVWLKAGDVVTSSIEKLGDLTVHLAASE